MRVHCRLPDNEDATAGSMNPRALCEISQPNRASRQGTIQEFTPILGIGKEMRPGPLSETTDLRPATRRDRREIDDSERKASAFRFPSQ